MLPVLQRRIRGLHALLSWSLADDSQLVQLGGPHAYVQRRTPQVIWEKFRFLTVLRWTAHYSRMSRGPEKQAEASHGRAVIST